MGVADVALALTKAAGKSGESIAKAAAKFSDALDPKVVAKASDLVKLAADAGIVLNKADEAMLAALKAGSDIDPKVLADGTNAGRQIAAGAVDDAIAAGLKNGAKSAVEAAQKADDFTKSVIKAGGDNQKLLGQMTGKGLGAVGDTMSKSKSFFDKLPEATKGILIKAGLGAAAIGAVMLITGETDPAKAIGDQAGKLAGAAGAAVGEGLGAAGKGFFGGSGLGDFFSKWGIYIGGFFACILLLYLFSMFTKKR